MPDTPAWQRRVFWWSHKRDCLYWLSGRGGWFQIYEYPRTGTPRLLTPGEYTVREIVCLDEQNGWLYFTASGREMSTLPYYRYLYRLDT